MYTQQLNSIREFKIRILGNIGVTADTLRSVCSEFQNDSDDVVWDTIPVTTCIIWANQFTDSPSVITEEFISSVISNNLKENEIICNGEDLKITFFTEGNLLGESLLNVGALCLSPTFFNMENNLDSIYEKCNISASFKEEADNFTNNYIGKIIYFTDSLLHAIESAEVPCSTETAEVCVRFIMEHERVHMTQTHMEFALPNENGETHLHEYNRQPHEVEADYIALTRLGLI